MLEAGKREGRTRKAPLERLCEGFRVQGLGFSISGVYVESQPFKGVGAIILRTFGGIGRVSGVLRCRVFKVSEELVV